MSRFRDIHREHENDRMIEVAVIFIDGAETDAAYKIIDPASKESMWIPFSQTQERHRDKTNHGTIVITEWIARQKGLIK